MMLYLGISLLSTWLLLLLLLETRLGSFALDQPNQRSLHHKATPRTGGVALMSGVLLAYLWLQADWLWIGAIVALMTVSLADDVWRLPARYRLIAHLAVCAVLVWSLSPTSPVVVTVMLVLALGWMSNLYNFMDGSDGLAGGMAVFGFGFYALAGYMAGDMEIVSMALPVVAASVVFLCFNFHPARIFMGDAGSIPLGFLAGALGFYGYQRGIWPCWYPVAVFSPFVVDASVTLLKRMWRGERLSEAHRSHYYQRLVQMGYGHRRTALAEYAVMTAVGISALWCLQQSTISTFVILTIWVLLYVGVMYWVDVKWRLYSRRG